VGHPTRFDFITVRLEMESTDVQAETQEGFPVRNLLRRMFPQEIASEISRAV